MESKEIETKEKPNSVEVSINAKNQWSGKIKAYGETLDEAWNIAIKKAEELEQKIHLKNI